MKEIKKDGSVVAKSLISSIISGYSKNIGKNILILIILRIMTLKKQKNFIAEALKELGITTLKLNLLSGNSDPEKLEIQFLQEELKTKFGTGDKCYCRSF